jgi:hypothetical protein
VLAVAPLKKNMSLVELEALLNEGKAPEWLIGKQGFVVEDEQLANAIKEDEQTRKLFEEALALALAELRRVFDEFSTGRWVRNLVINTANDELDKLWPDSPQAGSLRHFRDGFRANFAAIAADAELREGTRLAAFKAMFQALAIGVLSSRDADLVDSIKRNAEQARAAKARQARARKYAPEKEAMLAAVHAAMEARRTTPTRGEAFARLIEADVNKLLGLEGERKLSIWTIRNAVRAIL